MVAVGEGATKALMVLVALAYPAPGTSVTLLDSAVVTLSSDGHTASLALAFHIDFFGSPPAGGAAGVVGALEASANQPAFQRALLEAFAALGVAGGAFSADGVIIVVKPAAEEGAAPSARASEDAWTQFRECQRCVAGNA